MTLKDLWRAVWLFSKRNMIRVIFGSMINSGESPTGLPPELKAFIDKYSFVLVKALLDGKDIPFFGDHSDWPAEAHKKFLQDYINGASVDDLFETHIGSDDDIDYFQYDYGAGGDLYDIEDDYQPESEGITSAWYDLGFGLADDIKYGIVSMSWLEAATELGVVNWSAKDLDKLSKTYAAVSDKL